MNVGIASGTNDALVQTLNQKSSLLELEILMMLDATDNRSLEEIGTQQKLNDYRSQFKYYEGNFG